MNIYHHQIESAKCEIINLQTDYLRRFGWEHTSNTPGSYWLWRRDFALEDAARHKRWKEAGPGPYGWPSEPHPYGVITAPIEIAVSMTASCLDEQPELGSEEDA